jgi:hypothetical protein
MVFVDKTSKDDRTIYRHYRCSVVGTHATISANFVRGERYSLVAALSLDGYEAVRAVPGSVDGEEFLDFIVNDVVCQRFYVYKPKLNYLSDAEDESLPSRQEHIDS